MPSRGNGGRHNGGNQREMRGGGVPGSLLRGQKERKKKGKESKQQKKPLGIVRKKNREKKH